MRPMPLRGQNSGQGPGQGRNIGRNIAKQFEHKQFKQMLHGFGSLLLQPAWGRLSCFIGLLLIVGHGADATPRFGGEIRVAINSDIRSTNPGVNRDGNTDMVLYHIVESLVAYREDLTVAPVLAKSYEVSADGLSYTFVLRDNLRFHNGRPVTAYEVKWSWDRLLNPQTGFRCLDWYDGTGSSGLKILDVAVIDAKTVRFRLNRPSTLFLQRMAYIQCLTGVIHPDSVNADGSWREPIGTGPYRLRTWKRGKHIVLARFADYQARTEARNGLAGAKIAYADTLRFVVNPDRIAAKVGLYANDLDLVFATPLGSYREAERRRQRTGDIRLYHHATLDWTVLLIQSADSLFKDEKMRRAIAHAIIPDQVAAFASNDLAAGNSSAVANASPFHTALHGTWLNYDPARAGQLAQQAGYRGEEIVIQTNRKFSYMFDNAIAIQAMLHAAGFNVRVEVLDWASQLGNFFSGKFQLSSFGYSARSHPAFLYGNIIGRKSSKATYQWESAAAKKLLWQIENSTDTAEQQRIFDQLHELMKQQVPIIGLYNDHIVDITRSHVRDYSPWVFGRPRLWGVWLEKNHTE